MDKKCVGQFIGVLISITLFSNITLAAQRDITGIWIGKIQLNNDGIRVVFKISEDTQGSFSATMDSPDQGAKDIPISKVTFENNKILLEVQHLKASYEGTLKSDGSFYGQWKQSGTSFELNLNRTNEAPKVNRPQEPKKPYPYLEEEVTIKNPEAKIKLAGTLTIPRSDKPCPAVILISGSGAEDRDETIYGHKPFWILTDYLTRNGVAVLRVDDRGVGGSTGDTASSTSEDFAGDVICEVNFLKTRKEIDSSKIGLIGHSEGGIIAPIAANKSNDVAFIVMMAGTGLTGEEILYLQNKLILKAAGATDEMIAKQIDFLKEEFAILKNETDEKIIEEKTRELLSKQAGGNEEAIEKGLKQILNPWFQFFLTYDPAPALKKVQCPVLALNGSLDLQVAPKENLAAIESALKAGGNKDYTIKELPGLNHLFQTAKTGSVSEYAQIEETISPDVLKLISDWILKQANKL